MPLRHSCPSEPAQSFSEARVTRGKPGPPKRGDRGRSPVSQRTQDANRSIACAQQRVRVCEHGHGSGDPAWTCLPGAYSCAFGRFVLLRHFSRQCVGKRLDRRFWRPRGPGALAVPGEGVCPRALPRSPLLSSSCTHSPRRASCTFARSRHAQNRLCTAWVCQNAGA